MVSLSISSFLGRELCYFIPNHIDHVLRSFSTLRPTPFANRLSTKVIQFPFVARAATVPRSGIIRRPPMQMEWNLRFQHVRIPTLHIIYLDHRKTFETVIRVDRLLLASVVLCFVITTGHENFLTFAPYCVQVC